MSTTEEELGHLEEVRARLEARGLLRTASETAARIPEIASPTIVLPDAGDGGVVTDPIVVAGAPLLAVSCPTCHTGRHVGVNRTSFECHSCADAWCWAICGECDRLALTSERQESWRCRACGSLMRSWWKTTLPTSEPSRVIRKRSEQLVTHQMSTAAKAQQRTTRTIATRLGLGALALLVVVAGSAVLRTATAGQEDAVCGTFHRLMGQVQTGAVAGPELRARLGQLEDAAGPQSELRRAAAAMASAPSPLGTDFAVARTSFQDTCRRLTG